MKNWNDQEKRLRSHCSGLDQSHVLAVIRESKKSTFRSEFFRNIIIENQISVIYIHIAIRGHGFVYKVFEAIDCCMPPNAFSNSLNCVQRSCIESLKPHQIYCTFLLQSENFQAVSQRNQPCGRNLSLPHSNRARRFPYELLDRNENGGTVTCDIK